MDTFDERLQIELAEGKIVLGGCCVIIGGPRWQCVDCEAEICHSTSCWNPKHKMLLDKYLYSKSKPKKCPRCGEEYCIAVILYGEPNHGAIRKQLDSGEIVLGGCCMDIDGPVWECIYCGAKICMEKQEIEVSDLPDLPF